jgi:CheY-like chemotaxis protein
MERVILVIEDEPKNRKLLREFLTQNGFLIREAVDGQAGLEAALAAPPDLILMDIQLPVLNGLEATRRLKQDARTRKAPVIALTSYAMPEDRELCLDAGCADYLAKPISLHHLLGVIRWHRPTREDPDDFPGAPDPSRAAGRPRSGREHRPGAGRRRRRAQPPPAPRPAAGLRPRRAGGAGRRGRAAAGPCRRPGCHPS